MRSMIVKKCLLISACCLLLAAAGHAQGVGIGTTAPNASAQLDISSSSKGVLMPRVSTVQRKAIANPAFGLLVFDTDKACFYLFDGQNWKAIILSNDADIPPIVRNPTGGMSASFNTYMGASVAIAGNYAIGGNPFAQYGVVNSPGFAGQGEAYVFSKTNNWTQTQLLKASDGGLSPNDCFGYCIAMHGNLAVIGAPGAIIGANTGQGAAYVFSFNGSTWTQIQKLQAPGNSNDNFGYCVSTDGNTIAIGAPNAQTGGRATGAVYTFTPNPSAGTGTPWVMGTTLGFIGAAAGDGLGTSVYVRNGLLVAGAPGANNKTGYACVYSQNNSNGGNFVFDQVLSERNPAVNHRFGASVTINATPDIIIGSPGFALGGNTGLLSEFHLSGTWTPYIATYSPTDVPYSNVGYFVSTSVDGTNWFISFNEATSGMRVFQGMYGTLLFFIKSANIFANLYPLAMDGTTVVYTTDNGFSFKDLQ